MTPENFKIYELSLNQLEYMRTHTTVLDRLHYEETEAKYKKVEMDPSKYAAQIEHEQRGNLVYFTAVDVEAGVLVGHVVYYVAESTHSDSLNATEDRYFIVKEHRGSGLARRLLRYAEKCLKERGVTDIFMSSKSPLGGPKIDTFLVEEGFAHVANVFHKAV